MSTRRGFLGFLGASGAVAASAEVISLTAADAAVAKDPVVVDPKAAKKKRRQPKASTPTQEALGVVSARVDKRLLTKASRMFTGSVSGRMIELLQNARRASADKITINVTPLSEEECREVHKKRGCKAINKAPALYQIEMIDNGSGIQDFGQLLAFGFSGWDDDTEASEDPAGAGFFSLSPREVLVQSNGKEVIIDEAGWLGTDVKVRTSNYVEPGTRLVFVDEEWEAAAVRDACEYSGMLLTYNGEEYPAGKFEVPHAPVYDLPEFGVRVQVVTDLAANKLVHYSRYGYRTFVNFYGQIIKSSLDSCSTLLGQEDLSVLIDMSGLPTEIRMTLPDRKSVIDNDAWKMLDARIEKIVYEAIAAKPQHKLTFRQYSRGRELGVNLSEAACRYHGPGCADWGDSDQFQPVMCGPPRDTDRTLILGDELDDGYHRYTLDFLYSDGLIDEMPITIDSGYSGYSWAKLPRVVEIDVDYEPFLSKSDDKPLTVGVSDGTIVVAKSILVSFVIQGSDDADDFRTVVVKNAKMAMLGDQRLAITVESLMETDNDSAIWHVLGGYYEDDSQDYDTQQEAFQEELTYCRQMVHGPTEPPRTEVTDAALNAMHQLKQCPEFKTHANRVVKSMQVDMTDYSLSVTFEDGHTIVVRRPEYT